MGESQEKTVQTVTEVRVDRLNTGLKLRCE